MFGWAAALLSVAVLSGSAAAAVSRRAGAHAKTKSRAAPKCVAAPKEEPISVAGAKVAMFAFTGDDAEPIRRQIQHLFKSKGIKINTALRPVDSAEQYREMAATLRLAAYIDGTVGGAGSRGQATVRVRSGVTGRRIASVRFSADRSALAENVGSGLWPRTGSQLAHLCGEAAKPSKGGRRALRIDAGTPIEAAVPDSDIPAHLRNDPKDRRKNDPWADEGT